MENCDKVLTLFGEILDLHIGTKTNDSLFHSASAAMYEAVFDAYHGTKEALQDSKQDSPEDAQYARKRAYEILMEVKTILEGMVNDNKDIGTDNVLRGLVDKIGFQCGAARAFISGDIEKGKESVNEESESEEESKEEVDEPEESEETSDDLMGDDMEESKSGYEYSSKSKDSKEEDIKKKRRGSTEYTVVSIMP